MDYRMLSLQLANKKAINKVDGIRLKHYFVEYARESAQRANINTEEFKRTNKLMKAYPIFQHLFTTIDIIFSIAKTLDSDTDIIVLSDVERKVIEDWTMMATAIMKQEEIEDDLLFGNE